MRVFAATFNLAQLPLSKDSTAYLDQAESADLVILAFQEALPLRLALLGPLYTDPAKVQNQLQEKLSQAFELTHRSSYGGLLLLIYVKTGEKGLSVQQVSTSTCGVGPLYMRNKGAIGIRMSVAQGGDTHEYTVVCAHLAPHVQNTERRNADWQECVQRLRFDDNRSVYDTDMLLVLGDLNYRLSEAKEEVKASFSNDQLTAEMKAGRTMHHLREAPINFPPSYKYKANSPAYDTKRRPAWCDRILHWTRFESVKVEYDMARDPTSSDHRPVMATFTYQPQLKGSRQISPFSEDSLASRKAFCGQLCSFIAGSVWNLAYAMGLGNQVLGGFGVVVVALYLIVYY